MVRSSHQKFSKCQNHKCFGVYQNVLGKFGNEVDHQERMIMLFLKLKKIGDFQKSHGKHWRLFSKSLHAICSTLGEHFQNFELFLFFRGELETKLATITWAK